MIMYAFHANIEFGKNVLKKSTDGGLTWECIDASCPRFSYLHLSADPNSSQRILFADKEHLYFSADGGAVSYTHLTLPTKA